MFRTWVAVLLCAVAAASAAELRCFVREYKWEDDAGLGWAVEIDTLVDRPELLELGSLAFQPVKPGSSGCLHHQRHNTLEFGWAVRSGGTVPFASFATHCEDRVELAFGVSTMGAEVWGPDARHITDGSMFAPQGGRVDMQTGTTNVREHASRWRRLTARWATGSHRQPGAPIMVHVCALEHDNKPLDVPEEWREVGTPRILPLADCVREFGGHCGVNVGWVAQEDVSLRAHTDTNRVHPQSLENGWHLPSVFDAGAHLPGSLKPHFHLGWACDLGLRDVEAKWHLDGYTLHMDHLAARCNDPLADEQPGRTFVWSTKDEDNMQRYKVQGDHVNTLPAQHHPNQKPHSESFTQAQAEHAWKKAGVETPVLADRVHSRSARQVVQDEGCGCGYGCCTDCDDSWWVLLVLFGLLLLVPAVFIGLALCGAWDWNDWHSYEDPASRTSTTVRTRYYADQEDYRRTHGREPPVHTHQVAQQTTSYGGHHYHHSY